MAGWLKLLRNVVLGLAVLLILAVAAAWFWSYPPAPGAFFRAEVPEGTSRGTLVRSETFATAIPEGASARRILYKTTLTGDAPALSSAIVMWQEGAGRAGDRPVVVWANGTHGVVPGCAASMQKDPFANIPAIPEALAEGWVFVSVDYAGLATKGPHPYLIGDGQARSVLDAARAVRQLEEVGAGPQTVIWGHSQGGNAALWSGILWTDYAPQLELAGIAAVSAGSDLTALLTGIEGTAGARLFGAYVARAYGETYEELSADQIVRPGIRWQARAVSDRCITDARAMVPVLIAARLSSGPLLREPLAESAFGARLRENEPRAPIPAPVLMLQGAADELVSETAQRAFVAQRCAQGGVLDYRVFDGHDHLSIVQPEGPSTPALIGWTRDRLSGREAASACP
jgi:acetyl esterase/lipase